MVLPLGETKEGMCEAMEEEDTHDHISDLPDSVIAHILSLLLDPCGAIATRTLSTRWTHLWKSINILFFLKCPTDEVKNYRNFIDRVLHLRDGTSSIDRFTLHLDYNNEDAHLVDSWIHYAVTHSTRVLHMRLSRRVFRRLELNDKKPYELQPYFYSNASVEELFLVFCKLDIPPSSSSRFGSLLNVHLACVSLGDGAIKNLTSTSPRLRRLKISNCTWEGSIHIDNHPNLKVVSVIKDYDPAGDITIQGPNLKALILEGTILMGRCRIKDLSSGVALSFNFEKMFEAWDGVYNNADADRLIELLDRLRCIPIRLHLCSWCIQVLTIRGVMAGGAQSLNILPLNIVELELETTFKEWRHPEIPYLLRRCRNLQNLTIDIGSEKKKKYKRNVYFLNKYEYESWRAKELSSSSVIEHIKTVNITSFIIFAYLHAKVKENTDLEVIQKMSIRNEIKFIKFLLQNLVALEKMTISTVEMFFNQLLPKSKSLQKFLVFLEDFPKVEIIF